MAVSSLVIPAMAAGFFSFQGSIQKNVNETLTIPEGMINIGGNMMGYLIKKIVDFNPYASENKDSSFNTIRDGEDIYIYACQHTSGIAKLICSKNISFPSGYDATNSRRIGGFHSGRVRPVSARYTANYLPLTGIIPNSCWDLQHRPRCEPSGMVEVASGGFWVDIYLNSVVSGSWPDVIFGSRHNAAPVRSTGGYNELDLGQGIFNAGKKLPTVEQFIRYAYGAPQGADNNNDTAWTMTSNTGPCNTGAVARAVSCCNVVDAVGSLWERLDNHLDLGNATNTYAWDSTVVTTGQDAAFQRGQVSHCSWRSVLGGGYWVGGARSGARTLVFFSGPWASDGAVGVRGVSDPL